MSALPLGNQVPDYIRAILEGRIGGPIQPTLPPTVAKAPMGVAGTAPKTGLAGFNERLSTALGSPMGQLGLNLLAQSGPSVVPRSLGQTLGQAGLNTLEAQNNQRLMESRQRLIDAQIGALNRPQAANRNVQSQFITEDGKLGFLRRDGEVVVTNQDVRDSFNFQTNPDGSVIAVNRSNPQESVPVISEDDARRSAERAGETTRRVEAQGDLGEAEDSTQRNLDLLDRIEGHPGFSGAVGIKDASSLFGLREQPLQGTEEADFVALTDQISGSAFLQAFQDLKGGGHITEIEGQKAEQAISRLRNRNQSEEGYRQAIEDLREVLRSGLDRKRRTAGVGDEFEGFSIKR